MASLKDRFQAMVPKLFDKLTGIPYEVTYRVVESSYNLGGSVDNLYSDYNTRVIQDELKNYSLNTDVARTSDTVFLMATVELPVAPVENDLIHFKGRWYTVNYVDIDPADAMWVLACGEGGID